MNSNTTEYNTKGTHRGSNERQKFVFNRIPINNNGPEKKRE